MRPEGRPARAAFLLRARELLGVGFPPVRRRAFWAVQGLVFVIAGTHTLVETVFKVEFPPPLYLVPTSLFFVPVVYAALRFGARGSIITALWSIALTVPNVVLLHGGFERAGITWQFVTLLAIALFVGARVDLERQAHAETEARERDLRASEARYRALFDNAAEAVLVIDGDGRIDDANEAATRLLGGRQTEVVGLPLREVAEGRLARAADATSGVRQPIELPARDETPAHWLEPVVSGPLVEADGRARTQLMLHDVTLRYERQQGLERYARRTVTAREEERRRIGRELHDGPLQALMLVGRKLDAIDAAASRPDGAGPAEEARAIVEATAAEVRRISRALRPSILDDLGLVPALRSEVAALGRRSGIRVTFAAPATVTAASEVELMLLRVAQEALRNAERHSGATHVAVRLRVAGGSACLVVRDTGRGPGLVASAAQLLAAGQMGVVGMEERARLVGGEFVMRAARPNGTLVCASAPLALPPDGR